MSSEPAAHYDRVTAAWRLLLGEELHYGVFRAGDEQLSAATGELTRMMIEACAVDAGVELLDVGCGTGAPACLLAREHGARVTGITTSVEGIRAAEARAEREGVADQVSFEQRDGMDNGFADRSFDRVWALESSHLMRDRDRVVSEMARVLRPGGRFALCDIIRRRELTLQDVRRLREPLVVLREVFGDARMEPLEEYRRLMEDSGVTVDSKVDLTSATRPTFSRWRENAEANRDEVVELLSVQGWEQFVQACSILDGFWDDGTLGYGLIAGSKT